MMKIKAERLQKGSTPDKVARNRSHRNPWTPDRVTATYTVARRARTITASAAFRLLRMVTVSFKLFYDWRIAKDANF